MARAKEILFRIFYSTSYTFVFFITLAFICASPADTIYQSYRRRRLIDIAFIAGAYVLTGLLALLIYASRVYTNRSIISAIPKTYMPIDEDELPRKRISRYITNILLKSAVVAYQAKPRSKNIEQEIPEAKSRIHAALHPEDSKGPVVTNFEPQWDMIGHRGWSSPAKDELPNLEYATVVGELTDLLEAKAVSLASATLALPFAGGEDQVGSERIVEVTRSDNSGMRDYVTFLTSLGMLANTSLVVAFLAQYEQARFAPVPLSEEEFNSLMRTFADLLRSMRPPDDSVFGAIDLQNDHQIPGNVRPSRTEAGMAETVSLARSSSLSDTANLYSANIAPARVSEDSVPSQATDESRINDAISTPFQFTPTARSRANTRRTSRTDTARSRVVSTQRPILRQQRSQASGMSSHSGRSNRSGRSGISTFSNTGSVVVRLNDDNDNETRPNSSPFTIEMASDTSAR